MGAALSVPMLLAPLAPVGACCGAVCLSMFTSTAASAMCTSCHCRSSVATRVGFAILFCLDAFLAWITLTPAFAHQIESYSLHYLKMQCAEQASCYRVMSVHRITFALALFHLALAVLLLGVHDTRSKRAEIQNGWWGPKITALLTLIVASFFLPNALFVFWANYGEPAVAVAFILMGLVLLVDMAHTWSEVCLERWERDGSDAWMYVLVGSTAGLYALVCVTTALLYRYFAADGCALNRTVITVNAVMGLALTLLCVHPRIQEANPRSGLAQCSVVLAYCTYLVVSALMNRDDPQCNPIARGRGETSKSTTAVVGAAFTFMAVAYSTTRAATHTRLLAGSADEDAPAGYEPVAMHPAVISEQPQPHEPLRIQAIRSAVQAGSLPSSTLEEELDAMEDAARGTPDDDELAGTKYNYTFFHVIFFMAACYLAMLLTDWQFVHVGRPVDAGEGKARMVYLGVSSASMWIRIASSWACAALYAWSLLAPAVLPERFEGI